MRIGFLTKFFDEDLSKLLGLIKEYEFFILEKNREESEVSLNDNVKLIRTLNFEKIIRDNEIKILFIDKDIDLKSDSTINIKIIDNELESLIFDYEFFAVRTKTSEKNIYFPYFIDFNFFSKYKNKLKKYDRITRITILTNSFEITLVSFLEKLLELRKLKGNLNLIVYKIFLNNQNYHQYHQYSYPFVNFITRELNKKDRAELFFNSNLIIALENRKKEVLEAMALKRIVITNDGFLGTPTLNFDNFFSKIERLLSIGEYEANQIISKQFDIESVAKIFEEELQNFIETKISRR